MPTISLHRSYCWEHGTWGELVLPDGTTLAALERPWKGNAVSESCIPEGRYVMELRESSVVRRTSVGAYERGWEITGVEGRTYIMFHPGNWIRNSEGCVLVGMRRAVIQGEIAVANSQEAFERFMAALNGMDEVEIDIRPHTVEYP